MADAWGPNGANDQDPTEEELSPISPPCRQNSTPSSDRDLKRAELEKERKESLIKAWEESEKSKAEIRCQKKLSDVKSWELIKRSAIQKEAEEKRALIKAEKEKKILEVEEMAAKFKASGVVPKSSRRFFF